METIESLKRRIRTAEDLHALVRTMKALAAVNIRQLEHAVESLADYQRTVELGLRVVLGQHPELGVSARTTPDQRVGVVVFGSDQGMCGQLNDQIVAYAAQRLVEMDVAREHCAVLAVGGRAATRLEDAGWSAESTFPVPGSAVGITSLVQDVLLAIQQWHTRGQIEHVLLFYSEHVSRAWYRPCTVQLLPIDRTWLEGLADQQWPSRNLPTFSMGASQLFSHLVRQYLFVSLFRAFAESMASENASRLTAMRGAERNVGERIDQLTHLFHQQRQMTITEELLDIASGFEALMGEEKKRA
jgi:F-type H+-transporting ATPase subunit gamma